MTFIADDVRETYFRLHDYAETVFKLNPGTVFKFSTLRLDGCTIVLDGCFLNGPYGEQLLSVVGNGRDDNIFPIALAIVEIESRDSWE